MLKRCLVYFIVLVVGVNSPVSAQLGFELAGGVQHLSLGRTSVTLTGPASVLGNQAAMTYTENLDISVNAARRYNISGLDIFSVGFTYNSDFGSLGASVMQYGFEGYKEQKIGLAYAKKIASGTSIGLQMNVMNLSVPEFDSKSFFTVEFGLYSELSPIIHLGFHVFSPGGISIDGSYDIPTRIRIGPKFLISPDLSAFLELEKIIDLSPAFKSGLAYELGEKFEIRIGVIPSHSEFSFGFKYNMDSSLGIEGAFLYDQRLGTTPAAGITYSKK